MPATICLVFLLLLWLSRATPNQETGSYSQPQSLCCLGIDHHCKRGSCYCDEFCHVVLDCYPDHYALCNPASQNTKMVLRMVLRMENPPPETCKKQSRLDAAPGPAASPHQPPREAPLHLCEGNQEESLTSPVKLLPGPVTQSPPCPPPLGLLGLTTSPNVLVSSFLSCMLLHRLNQRKMEICDSR